MSSMETRWILILDPQSPQNPAMFLNGRGPGYLLHTARTIMEARQLVTQFGPPAFALVSIATPLSELTDAANGELEDFVAKLRQTADVIVYDTQSRVICACTATAYWHSVVTSVYLVLAQLLRVFFARNGASAELVMITP